MYEGTMDGHKTYRISIKTEKWLITQTVQYSEEESGLTI